MSKRRHGLAKLVSIFLLVCLLARVTVSKPADLNNDMIVSVTQTTETSVSENLESSVSSIQPLSMESTTEPKLSEDNSDTAIDTTTKSVNKSENNISLSVKNNTVSPIVKLAHDLTKLYNAVSSFITPWFSSPQVEITIDNPQNETAEPEFNDFEDPAPIKESDSHQEKIATSVLRFTRDVMESSDKHGLVASILTHTGKFLNSENAPHTLKNNTTLGKVVRSVIRHVRSTSEGRENLFQGYYDFAINEYSYKFWAVYMLAATAILLYSAVAAIYYAKFNTSAIDYETYDDIARSNNEPATNGSNPLGLVGSLVSVNTFQQIMDAISSKKFS